MKVFVALCIITFMESAGIPYNAYASHPVPVKFGTGPHIVEKGALEVRLLVDQIAGRNQLYVALYNPTADFVCVSSEMLDSKNQQMSLKDQSGNTVPLLVYGETNGSELLGFDYEQAYLFIAPREKRRIGTELRNFDIRPASYTYKISFLYYRCGDVIDVNRIKLKKNIRAFLALGSGTIVVLPEK